MKISATRYEIWQIPGQLSENGANFHNLFIHSILEPLKITVTKKATIPWAVAASSK